MAALRILPQSAYNCLERQPSQASVHVKTTHQTVECFILRFIFTGCWYASHVYGVCGCTPVADEAHNPVSLPVAHEAGAERPIGSTRAHHRLYGGRLQGLNMCQYDVLAARYCTSWGAVKSRERAAYAWYASSRCEPLAVTSQILLVQKGARNLGLECSRHTAKKAPMHSKRSRQPS